MCYGVCGGCDCCMSKKQPPIYLYFGSPAYDCNVLALFCLVWWCTGAHYSSAVLVVVVVVVEEDDDELLMMRPPNFCCLNIMQ